MWHRQKPGVSAEPADILPEGLALDDHDVRDLSSVFAAPPWLDDLGRSAWLIVGLGLLLASVIALLAVMQEIVGPMLAAVIIAAVTTPLVAGLGRHRVPRAAGAAMVLLGLVAVAGGVLLLVLGGIRAQHDSISQRADQAASRAESWLESAGVDKPGAESAQANAQSSVPEAISTLTTGIVNGIAGLASLAFALSFTALGIFFLLKDGPKMRGWLDRHLGVPVPVAQTITGDVLTSFRGYFRGVTLVGAFNGAVVGAGCLLLGVPLAGTIAIVTFVTAYVPYLGAFVSGAFAVVIALGAKGPTTAAIMLVIVLLANGLLQNILQPFLFGAALDLNPLVVLVVTIGAGCLFGMVGLILAAPLTSAAVHITNDLAGARAAVRAIADGSPSATLT